MTRSTKQESLNTEVRCGSPERELLSICQKVAAEYRAWMQHGVEIPKVKQRRDSAIGTRRSLYPVLFSEGLSVRAVNASGF